MRLESIISPREPAASAESVCELSPFVLEFFMVESLGYRGMAYCDADGNWRNAFNHEQLMGRVYLLE